MKTLFSLALIILCTVTSSRSQDCSQILKQGIYDVYSNVTDTQRAESFVNWFNQRDFHSYVEAQKYTAKLAIPVKEVLTRLNLTADEKGFEQFQKELQNYARQTSDFKQKIETFVRTINPDVAAAWFKCMEQTGVHVWLEYSADPQVFIISGLYTSDGGTEPKLTTMEFTPSEAIQFRKGTFVDGKGRLRSVKLAGARASQTFQRNPSKDTSLFADPVTINVTLTRGAGGTFSLPALHKPKPIISDFSASEAKINYGASSTLRWEVFDAKAVELEGVSYPNSRGTLEVKPATTKKFTLHARNDGGETTQEAIVEVVVPKLTGASVIFATGDDNKGPDTSLSIRVFSTKGAISATAGGYADVEFRNKTENPVPLSLVPGASKEDLVHGRIEIAINPKGKAHWVYKPKLSLTFADRSTLNTEWLGNSREIEADHRWSRPQYWDF
jgi:hypothetical protein